MIAVIQCDRRPHLAASGPVKIVRVEDGIQLRQIEDLERKAPLTHGRHSSAFSTGPSPV